MRKACYYHESIYELTLSEFLVPAFLPPPPPIVLLHGREFLLAYKGETL